MLPQTARFFAPRGIAAPSPPMSNHLRVWVKAVCAVLLVVFASAHTSARPGEPSPSWKFDEVVHLNGYRFQGLILKESPEGIDFQVVRRSPRRPTVTITTFFPRRDVLEVKRLSAADRAVLASRLVDLDLTGAGERQRMETLELVPATWLGRENAARRYESDQFVLISGAPDEVTRRAAVRLEQIYAAFARLVPPRHTSGRPTTVVLAGKMTDYAKM